MEQGTWNKKNPVGLTVAHNMVNNVQKSKVLNKVGTRVTVCAELPPKSNLNQWTSEFLKVFNKGNGWNKLT